MDLLKNMNLALRYIEENLTNDIDFKEVARLIFCSEYHFTRMFSFLAGVTLSEYIRRRRLTLAAFELKDSNVKVIDIAMKYGYNSSDSFASRLEEKFNDYARISQAGGRDIWVKESSIIYPGIE
jgi:AraC family transcriptional regulator